MFQDSGGRNDGRLNLPPLFKRVFNMAVKLNDKQIKSLLRKKESGYYAAGNGLYFRVSKEGTGFWIVRYTVNKKRREISMGRYPDLTLAHATVEAAKIKIEVRRGIRLNLIATNPAEAFTVQHAGGVEQSRSRYLTVKELTKVFTTFQNNSDQFTRENHLDERREALQKIADQLTPVINPMSNVTTFRRKSF